MAYTLSVAGFGSVTETDQLGPMLDRTIEIVQASKPTVVDLKYSRASGTCPADLDVSQFSFVVNLADDPPQ